MAKNKKKPPVKTAKRSYSKKNPPDPIVPPPPEPNPDDPTRPRLTPEEESFVIEYLRCFRVGQAYRAVFPHVTRMSSRNLGSRMYARVHVRNEINAEIRERRSRSRVKADNVIKAAYQLLMSDMADCFDSNNRLLPVRDIPIETRRWLQSFKDVNRCVTQGTGKRRRVTEERTREFRLINKAVAFGILAKHLGLDDKMPPIEIVLAMLPKEAAEVLRQLLAPQPTAPRTPTDAIAVTPITPEPKLETPK